MRPIACVTFILPGKSGFEEKEIRTPSKFHDCGSVRRRVRNIRHIGNLLSAADGHEIAQCGKRPHIVIRYAYPFVVGLPFKHGALQSAEPSACRETSLQKTVFPNIRMRGFAKSEPKTGTMMFKECDVETGVTNAVPATRNVDTFSNEATL